MTSTARDARRSWFGVGEADDLIRRWRTRLAGPAWSVVEYFWYPALLFATTPLFLHRLGTAMFGQWSLLVATTGMGVILSVGTGAATVRQVAAAVAAGGPAAATGIVRAALLSAAIGALVAAALVVAVFGLGATTWLARMGDPRSTLLTGGFAALLLALDQLDNAFSSTLRGGERFRDIARIEMIARTVQIAAAAVAVAMVGTLLALYTALAVAGMARVALRAWSVHRWLGARFLPPARGGLRLLLGDATWGWVLGAGSMAFGLADRFIVGSVLGAAALAHYSVASQLAQPLHAAIAAATSVVFPKVSAAMARGAGDRLRRLLTTAFVLLAGAASAGALLLFFGRDLILRLWLGPAVAAASAPAMGWLVIAYWVLALAVLPHYVLLGAGRIRFTALTNLAAGAVALAAMLWGARHGGIAGIAAARIVYGIVLMVNLAPLAALWRSNGKDPRRA